MNRLFTQDANDRIPYRVRLRKSSDFFLKGNPKICYTHTYANT